MRVSPRNVRWVIGTIMLAMLGIGAAACGGGKRRLNVIHTANQTLMTVGYSADRSQSIFKADSEAQEYCHREEKEVMMVKEDTIYQGKYSEDVTQTARAVGRVADALGSAKTGTASRSLSSPTDYKTTLEFQCK